MPSKLARAGNLGMLYPRAAGVSPIVKTVTARIGAVPGTWLPTPPVSYTATGAVIYHQYDVTAGPGTLHLYFPSEQHVCQNQYGVFATICFYDDEGANINRWRLRWSTDDTNWSTIVDSDVAGFQFGRVAPAVETDAAGNVYLLGNHYYGDGTFKLYKYVPNTTPNPTSYNLAGGYPVTLAFPPASGKYSEMFDQGRQWLWICTWEVNDPVQELVAVDLNGTVQRQVNLFNAAGTHAQGSMYPHIDVDHSGTIYVGWNNHSFFPPSTTFPASAYYSVHGVFSPDGGTTWYGANGSSPVSLPLVGDDSSTNNKMGFMVCDTTDPGEFLAATNPAFTTSRFNCNGVTCMRFHGGQMHFQYYSQGGVGGTNDHNCYVRVNPSTFGMSVTQRIKPYIIATIKNNATGSFVHDSTQTGHLYYVTYAGGGNYGKILVLKSDDNGDTWSQYALAAVAPSANASVNGLAYVQACRWVQPDGSIIGVAGDWSDGKAIFFRVVPV